MDIMICGLQRSQPDFHFFVKFFSLLNPEWLRIFLERQAVNDRFIEWNFMDGATSYYEALDIVRLKISEISSRDCADLYELAMAVLIHREADHARYPPGGPAWETHERVIVLWKRIVQALKDRL